MTSYTIHSELLEKLNAIDNDLAWYDFMLSLEGYLPVLFRGEAGKLSAEQRAGTIIELGGFSTWTEMYQASASEGGFGLKKSKWEEYQQAYKATKVHPWLVGLGFKAYKIIAMMRSFGDDFPVDLEDYKNREAAALQAKEKSKQLSLKQVEERNTELESKLLSAAVESAELRKQVEANAEIIRDITKIAEENATLKNKIEVFDRDLETKCLEVDQLKTQNENLSAEAEKFKLDLDNLESEIADRYEEKLKNAGFLSRLKYLFTI